MSPTPHISAEPGDLADVCLLPGDPLRARWVAERHLEGAERVTAVRNMEGYTGTHRGRRISVMGTGMGIPSSSIYATELISEYGVGTLIRIGSCGALQPELDMRDLIVVVGASTDSGVNRARFAGCDYSAAADFGVTRALVEAAEDLGTPVRIGNILSSDVFYQPAGSPVLAAARRMGLLAVENEAAGLFGIAAEHGVRAGTILTVAGVPPAVAAELGSPPGRNLTTEERESTLDRMVAVTLEAVLRL